MKIKVLQSSMVVDFLDVIVDAKEIGAIIELEGNKFVDKIKNDELINWEVQFVFRYTNTKQILIYRKDKSYPVERYKEITIHVPIPTTDKVNWGVSIEQHVYKNENYLDGLMNNFDCLDVNYVNFKSCKEYLLDCMLRSINFCFEKGFTINKVKVMSQNV